jgi:ferredoxin
MMSPHQRSEDDEEKTFSHLLDIAKKLKLEIFDLEEGIYGYDCKDSSFGLEVVQTSIDLSKGDDLGLVLTEMASSPDGRGLVLISDVSGNAANANPPIYIGDAITGIKAGPKWRERVTGSNYDVTVDVIGQAKEIALGPNRDRRISLELNRLVKRAKVVVEVDDGNSVTKIEALAGENLRRLLQRKGIQVYDRETKRFDMPFAKGDCAGEGLCGTCLVAVREGEEMLSPISDTEKLIMKGRPMSWRASCRTVVGADNKEGTLKISTHPQSRFKDELNPGVRSLDV